MSFMEPLSTTYPISKAPSGSPAGPNCETECHLLYHQANPSTSCKNLLLISIDILSWYHELPRGKPTKRTCAMTPQRIHLTLSGELKDFIYMLSKQSKSFTILNQQTCYTFLVSSTNTFPASVRLAKLED